QVVALHVGGRGADAGAGGAAGDQEGIDPVLDQVANKWRAGEGAGVFLVDDVLTGLRLHALVDGAGAAVPLAGSRRIIWGGLERRFLGVRRRGVNDRHAL